jgi:hypothetical protein
MAADVEEHADLRGGIAAQDDGPAAQRARDEIARRPHLALVARIDPALVEDAAHLLLEHQRVDHRRAMHAEVEAVGIVADEVRLVHGSYDIENPGQTTIIKTAVIVVCPGFSSEERCADS